MTLKRIPNPTLKGHKLLFITPWEARESFVSHIRDQFPDLQIATHQEQWKLVGGYNDLPSSLWDDVTILMTGNCLPQIEQAPNLQAVQLLSAGANDLFDKPLFLDTDITFCTANGVHGPQISEWVVSTFLAHKKKLPQYLELQREGKWKRLDEPDDSVGQRVGILGYGSIGRQVARVCTALGMDVHAYTFHPRPTKESRRDNGYAPPGLGDPDGSLPRQWFSGTDKHELHEFLASDLDLLVIALPLTDKTKGLIGKEEFKAMAKKKTFVSNIARGPIVDTDALIDALEGHVIRGAALDVTDPEPLPDGHKLWSTENLIVTPHISGRTTAYMDRACSILELNLTRLSEGKELINRVSRKDGY